MHAACQKNGRQSKNQKGIAKKIMNIEKIKQFNELYDTKQRLERELDQVKAQLNVLDVELQEEFATAGMSKITVGDRTTFIKGQIWAKYGKGNQQRVIEVLRSCEETKDLIEEGFHAGRLSAFIREKINAGQPLPREFEGVIDYVENFSVKSIKS